VAAARDFEVERHGGFTSYARRRIRASIREALLGH
jgi:DNA-directed RNA polymerase specialized sigma subunit